MAISGAASRGRSRPASPVFDAIRADRSAIIGIALFSALVNILMLTGSFYMLQVYDRVLASSSVPTLVLLSIMALIAYLFMGFLDFVRARLLGRLAEHVDIETGPMLYESILRTQQARGGGQADQQLFSDLDSIRTFLSGLGPVALFDMPWIPFYLLLCFVLHPYIGVFALVSMVLLVALAVLSEARSTKISVAALDTRNERNVLGVASVQGGEAILSMGMLPAMRRRWNRLHDRYSTASLKAGDTASGLVVVSKTVRMIIQSATLGLGAYLVIRGEMTPGTIIASSIISGRTIGPVDQAIGSYRSFVAARQGYRRLMRVIAGDRERAPPVPLPAPHQKLTADRVVIGAPNDPRPIIKGVSFQLAAGQALGVIGPSASGKSTLARALTGLWPLLHGTVAVDGASILHWDADALGRHVGYLPHDVQLFDGTIAENIARFDPEATPAGVFQAAREAGCYDLIIGLPEGFNTRIGFGGAHLSAGQRQRVGLARALYGAPFVVILDEPNSNLDAGGEAAVNAAILAVKARGGIVIVIAHRPSAIAAVDQVLVIQDGRQAAYGPRDEVLRGTVTNFAAISTATPAQGEPRLAAPAAPAGQASGQAPSEPGRAAGG